MLVLVNRLDDIEGRLSDLKGIAEAHLIAKVYLARVCRPFGSRVRSIVAPNKLDVAARMSDAAASKYFSEIADNLRTEGIEVELISAAISAGEIDKFIKENGFDVIVTSNGRSGLCTWPSADLSGRSALFLCEHIFGRMQPKRRKEPHQTTARGQKGRAR